MNLKFIYKYVCLVLLLATSSSYAEKADSLRVFKIIVNYPDYFVKASVCSKFEPFQPNKSKYYYWYSNNQIQVSQGAYEAYLLHGSYSAFNLNGSLREKGSYLFGLKNGEWITWYDNGTIKTVDNWRAGFKEGVSFEFDINGKIKQRLNYRQNLLHGDMLVKVNDQDVIKRYNKGTEVIKQDEAKTVKKPRKFLFKNNTRPVDSLQYEKKTDLTKTDSLTKNKNRFSWWKISSRRSSASLKSSKEHASKKAKVDTVENKGSPQKTIIPFSKNQNVKTAEGAKKSNQNAVKNAPNSKEVKKTPEKTASNNSRSSVQKKKKSFWDLFKFTNKKKDKKEDVKNTKKK